jgi:hypothetical protein
MWTKATSILLARSSHSETARKSTGYRGVKDSSRRRNLGVAAHRSILSFQ